MEDINWDRVDDAALALLSLTLHDGDRVWKQLDWGITDRLHERGLLSNPQTKTKSVCLSRMGWSALRKRFGNYLRVADRGD